VHFIDTRNKSDSFVACNADYAFVLFFWSEWAYTLEKSFALIGAASGILHTAAIESAIHCLTRVFMGFVRQTAKPKSHLILTFCTTCHNFLGASDSAKRGRKCASVQRPAAGTFFETAGQSPLVPSAVVMALKPLGDQICQSESWFH
jgi:hypothetical protein